MLPAISNRCMTFNESLHSKQLSVNSDGQGSTTSRRSSTWDSLMHHSSSITAEESTNLDEGIKGVTIGKKIIKDDRLVALPISNAQNTTINRLPRLRVNDLNRRWDQGNGKIEITINNNLRVIGGRSSHIKANPLNCFKITSLNRKENK